MGTWIRRVRRSVSERGLGSLSGRGGSRDYDNYIYGSCKAAGESPPGRAPARAMCGGQRGRSGTGPPPRLRAPRAVSTPD